MQDRRLSLVSAADLLDVAATPGTISEAGLRNDVAVALRYLGEWLDGNGAVAIFNLMEDAATAEIARSQVWQWLHNDVHTDDGTPITPERVRGLAAEELDRIVAERGDPSGHYAQARVLFEQVALADDYVDFLTVAAYDRID